MRAGDAARLSGLNNPGVYAWFTDEFGARDLSIGLGNPLAPGLIYAGRTGSGTSGATLDSRLRGNHLGGNTYGSTFRLTLASILRPTLGLRPLGRRRMHPEDEVVLTSWMLDHLSVSAWALDDRSTVDAIETQVLVILNPPLNLAKLPATPTRAALSKARSEFNRLGLSFPGQPMPERTSNPPTETQASTPTTQGFTPEELARDLRLPNAKSLRGFLRREFPRATGDLWSRWGVLPPDVERAVRERFGGRR